MRYHSVPRELRIKLYQHMKEKGISKLCYNYEPFFNDMVSKKRVCVFSTGPKKHFHGSLIRDTIAPTISYVRTDPNVRQNFTKCHELAHLLLNHHNETIKGEREANRVAGFILMPDIVLVAKIIYRKDSFNKLRHDLKVSAEALRIRLIQLIQDWTNYPFRLIQLYVRQYALGFRKMYEQTLRSAEQLIISDFRRGEVDNENG